MGKNYAPKVTMVVDGVEIPEIYHGRVARQIVAIERAEQGLYKLCWQIEENNSRYGTDPFDN